MEKSTAHTDDESPTDDSGFSDSRAFLKNDSPPTSPQQTPTQMEHIIGSGASYTPLIVADVHTAEYYKSVNRESIPGIPKPSVHVLCGCICVFTHTHIMYDCLFVRTLATTAFVYRPKLSFFVLISTTCKQGLGV